jgi:hypothetical protein
MASILDHGMYAEEAMERLGWSLTDLLTEVARGRVLLSRADIENMVKARNRADEERRKKWLQHVTEMQALGARTRLEWSHQERPE